LKEKVAIIVRTIKLNLNYGKKIWKAEKDTRGD